MLHSEFVRAPIGPLADHLEVHPGGELLQAHDAELVVRRHQLVVRGVGEHQRQHPLLLQVGLVDAGERLDDHGRAAEVPGLQRRVLPAAPLAVVLVPDHDPADARRLVVPGSLRDGLVIARELVLHAVGLVVLVVDGSDQHVVGDVVEVAAVLQPRARHADVVRGRLALGLDEHPGVLDVLPVPGVEGGEQLQPLALGVDDDVDARAVRDRGLVCVFSGVEACGGQLVAGRGVEHELLTIGPDQRVLLRVEGQVPGEGERRHELGGRHEGVRGRVAVVARGEVPVVGADDRVLLALLDLRAAPLADARAAGVGQHGCAHLLERVHDTIAADGGADLLGPRGHGERHLGLDARAEGLLGHGSGPSHVLVRGVGAAPDQPGFELGGPAVFLERLPELGQRPGQVGGEGPVDVGLELAQVDLDHLVVLRALIGHQVGGKGVREVSDAGAAGGLEVVLHPLVVREHGGGGPDLRAHVADGPGAGAGDGVRPRAEVLDDGPRTPLHCENAGHLEDDVLGARPAAELAGEPHADDLRVLQLPGHAGHHIDGVGAAHADGAGAQAAGVDGVGVRADHHHAGVSVVLQHDLVDDPRPGLPEADAELGAG
mmetsp:Transcript_36260/g.102163  ORF Transcript_36260/g.102163 Transcript_36260/m.102163 type:complete len:601 (-) Transcript_36260:497-2299(-)